MAWSTHIIVTTVIVLAASGCEAEQQKLIKRSIRGVSTGQTVEEAEAAAIKRGGKCYLRSKKDTIPPTSTYCIFGDDARLDLLTTEYTKPPMVYHMNYIYRLDRIQGNELSEIQKHLDLEPPADPEKEGPTPKRLKSGEMFHYDCSNNNPWQDDGCEINIQDDKVQGADLEKKEQMRKKIPSPKFD